MRSARILVAFLVSLAAAPALAQTNVTGIDFTANNSLGVSAASHARIRYNTGTGVLEVSYSGGAYSALVPAATTTLSQAYNNAAAASDNTLTLTAARGALTLTDAASTIGTVLNAQSNGATSYLLISGNATQVIRSAQVDGAGNVGTLVDTTTAFSTGKMLQIMSNGSERWSWQFSTANLPANSTFTSAGASTNTTAVTYTPNVADGATSIAFHINNAQTLSTTAKLLSVANNGTEKLNVQNGAVNLASAVNLVSAGGAAQFDFSAASGVFKSNTGAHTFGSATWSVPANLAVTGSASATNTTGILLTPNVADGATSVALKIDNTTAIPSGFLLQLGDNAVSRLNVIDLSTDGYIIKDSGGQSTLAMSTNIGTVLAYGGAAFSAGSASLTLTDGTNSWSMSAGLMTGQQLKMLPVNSSQTAATQSWRDSAGNGHFGVDSSGFPSLGSLYEFRENWMWGSATTLIASQTGVALTNSANVWTYTTTVNATGLVLSTGLATGSPITTGVSIGTGTANTNSTILRMGSTLVNPAQLSNLYVIGEWPAAIGAAGANNATFRHGISNTTLNNTHPGGWYFSKASTDTNWQCLTDDATTTSTTDSGVPPTASTIQIFRIEYYGAGSVLGAKTVKFYIDSTLVCTNTNNVYSANTVFYNAFAMATNTITQLGLTIGPVLLMYNEVASALIP